MKNSTITFKQPEGKQKTAVVKDTIVENGHTRYLTENSKGDIEIVQPAWIFAVEAPKEPKAAKEPKADKA